jgi:hypothetical protein
MEPNALTLSQDELSAYQLGNLMETTRQSGETAAEEHIRRAAIVEMYRSFEPANPLESMIACNCINLQFMLNAAMRDAANVNMQPATLLRMRASAVTISKTLHLWISKYESTHTRNEARAAEARRHATELEAVSAPAKPVPMRQPPAQEQPCPVAAQPPKAAPSSVTIAGPGSVAPPMPATPASGAADAPPSPRAMRPDAPPNGRLNVAAAPPVA